MWSHETVTLEYEILGFAYVEKNVLVILTMFCVLEMVNEIMSKNDRSKLIIIYYTNFNNFKESVIAISFFYWNKIKLLNYFN